MKIKHFAGYGSVEAKKTRLTKRADGTRELVVTVTGNHEWGLERDDKYDLFRWLVRRFDKTAKDDRDIISYKADDNYIRLNGLDVEQCTYTFVLV